MKALNDLSTGLRHFAGALRMKPIQALTWLACWSAWTLGSLQFYLLPFTLAKLAIYLHVKQSKISEANTTTMLSRSIGAAIFGIASDQYGRKIPLLVDLVLLAVFSLCSGFVNTYGQLVGVRFLFGMA
jgi:SHS family lactate transporter-like MFS transporter